MNWPRLTREALQRPRNMPTESQVYIVADVAENVVKIGRARDIFRRLSTLQSGNYHSLVLLGVLAGGRDLEHELHRLFETTRVGGEWFRYSILLDNLVVDAYEAGTGRRYCDRGSRA